MAIDRFPVEPGHILMFARAIADANPVYFDDDYATSIGLGGIIAPPTFVQAGEHFDSDSSLRPRPGQAWLGSGRRPSGTMSETAPNRQTGESAGVLHAEQHFTYHRHLRPGDVLTAETRAGETWQKHGRRSGVLTFSETITDYRDQDGELVITARGVGVRTERVIDRSGDGT